MKAKSRKAEPENEDVKQGCSNVYPITASSESDEAKNDSKKFWRRTIECNDCYFALDLTDLCPKHEKEWFNISENKKIGKKAEVCVCNKNIHNRDEIDCNCKVHGCNQ